MKKITYKDYIEGIKKKYEIEKSGVYSSYLSKPSPALLNDYCKILKQNGLSKNDQEIIELFYSLPNFDNDKFRPICNFFNGKTVNPSQDILDLMAVLVDFKPRPLGDFLKSGGGLNHEVDEETKDFFSKSNEYNHIKEFEQIQKNKNPSLKGKSFVLISIVIFLSLFIFAYLSFIQRKSCLEWKESRYVEVDCDADTRGFVNIGLKIPYNESLLSLRKIIPTDTTTYFENGKAVIWYCKTDDNHIELFNAPGHHPVNNKPLKAITEYMIEKYLKQ